MMHKAWCCMRGALSFFKVSSQISRLHRTIALASHLCTCVLHRQLCYLHTLKLPKFFNFHGDFHQKWHFAHPEFSFAHPELPFLAKSMHRTKKIADFDPNSAFPDCNSSLNSPMAFKWYTKLHIVKKRCPIVFREHLSNFKVARAEKSVIWIKLE